MEKADVELLAEFGWTVECESPLEIRHKDGETATGHVPVLVLDACRKVAARSRADERFRKYLKWVLKQSPTAKFRTSRRNGRAEGKYR